MDVFDLPSAKMEHVQTKSGRCRGDHTRPKKNAQDCYFLPYRNDSFSSPKIWSFFKGYFLLYFQRVLNSQKIMGSAILSCENRAGGVRPIAPAALGLPISAHHARGIVVGPHPPSRPYYLRPSCPGYCSRVASPPPAVLSAFSASREESMSPGRALGGCAERYVFPRTYRGGVVTQTFRERGPALWRAL
jgi:hypothetical protein